MSAGYPVFSATTDSSVAADVCCRVADCRQSSRSGRRLRGGRPACGKVRRRRVAEEVDDVAERVQSAEVLGLDRRGVRDLLLKGGQDFDALDRVDAQVGVQGHVQAEHVGRVARLLGDHRRAGCRSNRASVPAASRPASALGSRCRRRDSWQGPALCGGAGRCRVRRVPAATYGRWRAGSVTAGIGWPVSSACCWATSAWSVASAAC